MMMTLIRRFNWGNDIRSLAMLLSIILSIIHIGYQDPINLDGITYLKASASYLSDGFTAAMTKYEWPFYPILIAQVSKILHVPLIFAAHFLDTLFIAAVVGFFITLIRELGGTQKIQIWATLLILIYPTLKDQSNMILRDFGYLACGLLSLLYFIRYARKPGWGYAIAWSVTMVLGSLFRVEGIILLIFAPFTLFLIPATHFYQRFINVFRLYFLNILLFLTIVGILLINPQLSLDELGRLEDVASIFDHGITKIVNYLSAASATVYEIVGHNAHLFLWGGTTALLIGIWMTALTPLYIFLVGYALWTQRKLIPCDHRALIAIYGYCFINLLILIVFLLEKLFITDRYCMLLNLILLLATPYALAKIYENPPRSFNFNLFSKKIQTRHSSQQNSILSSLQTWLTHYGLAIPISIFICILSFNAIWHIGPSRYYIPEAGKWIRHHTPKQSKVYINDAKLIYYSHRKGTSYPEDFQINPVNHDLLPLTDLLTTSLQDYDYVALLILEKNQQQAKKILKKLPLMQIHTVKNNRGDKIVILKVTKERRPVLK